MNAIDLIRAKRVHLSRLANERGAAGETTLLASAENWTGRPKGPALHLLLTELSHKGFVIKSSSFDAIAGAGEVDFYSADSIRAALDGMVFIEIKTSNQPRVKAGFQGFFFALTESEIAAADQLGAQHKVALFNRLTGELLITSVPEILNRSKSLNWQVSVQL
jgi:hypothetical protein